MTEYIVRYENEYLQLLPDKMQELVRCKDCKYGDSCVKPYKDYWCNTNEFYRSADWFCADGVRRE